MFRSSLAASVPRRERRVTVRAVGSHDGPLVAPSHRLRVLLVPDSIHWITGTIAKSIVQHNPWLEGTIISGAVLDIVAGANSEFFDSFDIVHFVCPYASRQWLPVLRDRVPTVTSHHHVSDDYELQRHNLDGDAIVVGSRQWAADVIERGAPAERVICIPYGVDASRFVPVPSSERLGIRKSLGIASDAIVVGFFAKRSSNEGGRKGTDILAAAVSALCRELPTLVVLIIGPGWDELVSQLETAGVACVWLPFVRDASRMPNMYQALDFYWVTARVEGGPVTLLEAMSTGVCCMTTPVGLANDIVETDVNAVMVPFDDAAAFSKQTLGLVQNPALRSAMGNHARETILETMDVPVTSQGVRAAYDVASEQFHARNASRLVPANRFVVTAAMLEQIAILEELVWADALILQGQRALALTIMAETWVKNPFASRPPRFLFRNVLPQPIVRAMVRVAQILRRSA
jgi:glycosyltransferase involved in cell wall biosynthesis